MDPNAAKRWLQNQKKNVEDRDVLSVDRAKAAAIEVEAWLQSHGVAYAPAVEIPMEMIDEKRSRNNQARAEAIVPESVERFATGLRNGGVFPPIVCYPVGLSKVSIIDGNNRQAAARRVGRESIYGIVIAEETPSDLIQLLTVEANARHGVTPELKWRIKQAFYLDSLGYTDERVAQAVGISVSQLRGARAVREADQRASALRIQGFAELPATTKQVLNTIRDKAVFLQLATIAINTKMTAEEVRDTCRSLKSLPSEAARLEFLGKLARDRELERVTAKVAGKRLRGISSPQMALVAGIGQIKGVDPAALVRQIVTSKDLAMLRERIKQVEDHILDIQVALEQAQIDEDA